MRRLIGGLLAAALWTFPAVAQQRVPEAPGLFCPDDRVVWVNIGSGVYYYSNEHRFGQTVSGVFECEKAARVQGNRPSRKGK
jgi:hypothetical protein